MYQINKNTLGETLKEYRKINNMTLKQVGEKICKSKVTICKYENNEILPDFYTLLDLCNTLNIRISQLCEYTEDKIASEKNPFGKNELYMYYYSANKVIFSILQIEKEVSKYNVRFFNGIIKEKEKKKYIDYYEGEMISEKTITYFELNTNHKIIKNKVQIMVNIPYMFDSEVYNGVYTGITRNGLPIVKKVLISKVEIKNFEKYNLQLKFSKDDCKNMYRDNALIFRNSEDFEVI